MSCREKGKYWDKRRGGGGGGGGVGSKKQWCE